ncbi:conserved Plasmodium protein, unknown function [Plasmodium berghei]|uniref:Uncharacterized protein n=2 Tax=Plasmodium berghei TaxID=5821 RepID=A0A509ASS3_PLABA|nr:conserved Plasmodium protein, unknown function [Plasmodium berghei ANKA]CXI65863.1 conserved Plasmodium protein, unknown function [Plasmodium berghei]SCM23989.1 conserved Plasmodium protein, unknown function [Plasmodium berghei]SCN26871.1 conserved Plasmodium protein, unknown function [Plasmodium berghei]SCO61270.1 conserved Plasmodium protein, unknown function [Plasmodium berghei]SCO63292.1 conserved Plasmodium protein, unknown function [Plasmodium berghei]|eukprot:XP_034422487.1 conserved Plasmodium protein, unknown function [Plasmodium berghei ANKA]
MYGVYIKQLYLYIIPKIIYTKYYRGFTHMHIISFLLIYNLPNNFFCNFTRSIAICNLYLSFHSNIYILKYLYYCNICDLNVVNEITLKHTKY